jgi:hypothetical protein
MPFSNSTKRQRWLNGQVVPEYRTIMGFAPQVPVVVPRTGAARSSQKRTG